ncbi:MAG: kinase/pyrophosphorylase [Synergistetes bacterium]|nr:kinase/pyrophosphorylase [Synergistota bacterium]MCX8127310.1 kinase/pyrophosphorylase [Synergistota bacterium]MDW8191803.1 pyruvate, water dikinase regulatory protein [Synergistota bacterium]
MKDKRMKIFILSDSTGETAELVCKAALSQFEGTDYDIERFPHIQTEDKVDEVINRAFDEETSLVIYTLASPELRAYLANRAKERGIIEVDILGPLIEAFERVSGAKASGKPGLLRRMDEAYFRRIRAIEFAVKCDDGRYLPGIKNADVVIIGVSRSSKTPVSMYLAYRGIFAANVPLVPEITIPKELLEVERRRIVGLTIEPEKLVHIRQERLRLMGLAPDVNYVKLERVIEELEYAESVMRRLGVPIINVTNRAIEETAHEIIYYLERRGLLDVRKADISV